MTIASSIIKSEIMKLDPDSYFEVLDQAGPFLPFSELETLVDSASAQVQSSPKYQYMLGLLHGRMIHETEIGGIA